MSPEYAMEGVFSIKSDVYSFGVLLLEIISGRKNTSFYDVDRPLNLIGHAVLEGFSKTYFHYYIGSSQWVPRGIGRIRQKKGRGVKKRRGRKLNYTPPVASHVVIVRTVWHMDGRSKSKIET
ncbi:hypothetical protein Fmac_025163 [Flemingia macrophylla]|uniref:Serine-threonine/tyrosine-protein kinase catalytic domain-containing protein n=1 Tax=Flemingia macrophylla TaxID=520843 RepID=A0ABD1LT64_9FABA